MLMINETVNPFENSEKTLIQHNSPLFQTCDFDIAGEQKNLVFEAAIYFSPFLCHKPTTTSQIDSNKALISKLKPDPLNRAKTKKFK